MSPARAPWSWRSTTWFKPIPRAAPISLMATWIEHVNVYLLTPSIFLWCSWLLLQSSISWVIPHIPYPRESGSTFLGGVHYRKGTCARETEAVLILPPPLISCGTLGKPHKLYISLTTWKGFFLLIFFKINWDKTFSLHIYTHNLYIIIYIHVVCKYESLCVYVHTFPRPSTFFFHSPWISYYPW